MTYVLPVSGPSRGRSSSLSLETEAELPQLLDERAVLLVREPVDDVLGAVGAEALDLGDLLRGRRDQPVDGAEVAREVAREHPADPRDVEAEEDARERHLLASARSTRSPRVAEISAKPSSSSSCSFVRR